MQSNPLFLGISLWNHNANCTPECTYKVIKTNHIHSFLDYGAQQGEC